jgi:hypothetical protein
MFGTRRPVKAMLAAAALTTTLGMVSAFSPVAFAQEATPSASPIVVCNSPGLPPGEPSASPVAEMGGMDMAAASPVAEPELVGTLADDATAQDVTGAALNVVACLQESPELGLALLTPNFLKETFGTDNPYDVIASGQFDATDMFGNFTTGDVYTYEDGSVSVDVQYDQGEYQVVGERWFFTGAPGSWLLDSLEPITPDVEGDTAVVGVNLTEYAFEFNIASIVESEVVMLHVINAGAEAHEIVIFRASDTVTVDAITADAESALADAEFIGALQVPNPGEQADLALVGLEPGKYIAVCFLPDANGTPHFQEGMIAEFEILGL